jgi:hypothetical protein
MSEKLLPQGDVPVTPTLTNAQKYSPEFGFENGVVVEIDGFLWYFNRMEGEGLIVSRTSELLGNIKLSISLIKSIRLLSGPWASWQFAPADAIGVSIDSPFGDVKFFIKGEQKQFDEYRREHWTFTSLDAPWWWLEGKR